jgi:hypothetical protein
MGRYSSYSTRERQPIKKVETPAIWRGIGFAMILLIPFLAYVGSLAFIEQNNKAHWVPIPTDLIIRGQDPWLIIKILLTFVIAFILYMLFLLITFVMMRLFAPSRLGPMDAPRVAYRGKKKSR